MAAPSPSASSVRLPIHRSRRGSLDSLASSKNLDKDLLSNALDEIHSSASRTGTLTTFAEFASPPRASSTESKGLAGDLVQGGLSGLYNRLRASVGVTTKDVATRSTGSSATDSADDASARSFQMRAGHKSSQSTAGTIASSPVLVSNPTSKLQSPLVAHFQDSQPISKHPLDSSNASVTSRTSTAKPKSPAVAQFNNLNIKQGSEDAIIQAGKPDSSTSKSRTTSVSGSVQELSSKAPPTGGTVDPSHIVDRTKSEHKEGSADSELEQLSRARSLQAPFISQESYIEPRVEELDNFDEHTAILLDDPEDQTRRPSPTNVEPIVDRQALRITSRPEEHPSLRIETRLQPPGLTPSAIPEGNAAMRPPLLKISQSHLPGFRASRATSSDGDFSSVTTVGASAKHQAYQDPAQLQARGIERRDGTIDAASQQSKRQLLGKEFWMRDENARDCFNCGDAFSTFRRKHHCRTCGQIFDHKCTTLIAGALFGQSGSVRVCKPCESIINGTEDDDSSVYTDDDTMSLGSPDDLGYYGSRTHDNAGQVDRDHTKIGTPVMGIPVSRRTEETKRRSAIIEFDNHPMLARPSSSRSLRSLSGRPLSSSHKRHLSRHQHMRSLKSSHDDRAPFHRRGLDETAARATLPTFHHDNIIDPDLAAFLSDEGSSGDDQPSIFATLSGEPGSHGSKDNERGGFSSLLSAVRKGKSRGDASVAGQSLQGRDTDTISLSNRRLHRHSRHRNLSVGSVTHPHRLSPKRSKSNSLLKGVATSPNVPAQSYLDAQSPVSTGRGSGSKLIRSSSMRGIAAPAAELNKASEEHVKKLLKQMLEDGRLEHVRQWRKALMPILLQCIDDVSPDIQRNDDMDIRHYVKLKKIPGGKTGDTSYVSGVVFSKNVALKSMPRSIPSPRIAIITFPIEYARHQQHFMSLDPVISQEQEYLKNLVKRIVTLGPHVLLAEKNVSGLALRFLEEAHIAVISHVKRSVLNAVSRCTQAQLITSVDKLALGPSQLGRCSGFDVKTYVHKGAKKTYVFLSGCAPDLGCTIVLRGAEESTLRKVKRITEFMCFVVYNLKLETCLMRDEFVQIPNTTVMLTMVPAPKEDAVEVGQDNGLSPVPTSNTVTQASQKLQEMMEKDSSVPEDEKEPKKELEKKKLANDAEETMHSTRTPKSTIDDFHIPDGFPMPTYYGDMVEKYQTKILSASPFVQYAQPYLLMQAREQERRLAYIKRLRDQYAPSSSDDEKDDGTTRFELVKPEMMHRVVERPPKQVREFLYAVHHSEYEKAYHNYQTQKRQWEGYISGNTTLFDPFAHQRIAVLYSLVNSVTTTPCVGPEIIGLAYYAEHVYDEGFTADITLGQYIEDLCISANNICDTNGCDKKLLDHHRQYVHGQGQMNILVQKAPARFKGMQNTILMWSVCRKCGRETKTIPLSSNSWKYSFAKYLELTFWSSELRPRESECTHDIHKDHARYFGYNNMAVRIQYDPVHLYEVVVPRPVIAWKVAGDLNLKNETFLRIQARLDKFMTSVKIRIMSINVESVAPELLDACKGEIERMQKRASEDHEALVAKLQEKYMHSKYYEVVPLNRAIRFIQEKTFAWDDAFVDFERNFFPSEKDIRRLAALQLKKIFLDRDESSTTISSIEGGGDEQAVDNSGDNSQQEMVPMQRQSSTMSGKEKGELVEAGTGAQDAMSDGTKLTTNDMGVLGTADIPLQTPDMWQNSPTIPLETTISAVEQDGVRHLDLAVSQDALEASQNQDTIKASEPSVRPSILASTIPTASTVQTITNPTVTQEDQRQKEAGLLQAPPLPRSITAIGPGTIQEFSESKIPRPVANPSQHVPPPLNRTQSGPSYLVRKEAVGLPQPSNLSSLSVTPLARPEPTRPTMTDAAKALERRMSERFIGTLKMSKAGSHSMIPRSVPSKRNDSRVSTLAKHFEQLSREFEKERIKERRQRAARNRQSRAYPLASSKPFVEVYRDAHEAVQEHNAEEESPGSPSLRTSTDASTIESSFADNVGYTPAEPHSPAEARDSLEALHPNDQDVGDSTEQPSHISDVEGDHSDTEPTILDDLELHEGIEGHDTVLSPSDSQLDLSIELPKHEKTSLIKMLSSFWSERSSSGWTPLEYPFGPNEHVWEDSDIIVREDEPTSIIALALSCPDYLQKMEQFKKAPSDGEKDMFAGNVPPQSEEDASIERNLLYQKNTNIRYAFQKHGVRAQCKIFYAESFDALRRKCGVAERFVESLSRCAKYDSKGGKSKSIFLKTLDDRFVVKSLSPVEVNAFFKFAPNYFSFIHHNLFKGLLSVIAKMLGLFQVTIKNPGSGVEYNWFMLVMENLFYDRQPNRRFDLKGSMRNRKIQSTGESDEVLLDENLVDIIFERPIFVREHSKKLLKASVWNDTLFLSKQNVMDYSLMAGFDDHEQDIIVGIIDCIRTYTWDKKLETWIKDRGKNKPTITSPKDYRNRFRIAMSSYILQAPSCWHQFGPQQMTTHGSAPPLRLTRRGKEDGEDTHMESQAEVV